VTGTLSLTGSNVFSGGAVIGDLDDANIMLGVMVDNATQATFSGHLDRDSIKGEWECDLIGDHGVWYGTLKASDRETSAVGDN
jgi:hypothetical protein